MKKEGKYRVPDVTDYILSDAGAGSGYFFPSRSHPPPEDSALRYYCHRVCLLLAGGWDPYEAVRSLGVPDYNLFRDQFREYTGLTLQEYKEWVQSRKSANKGL